MSLAPFTLTLDDTTGGARIEEAAEVALHIAKTLQVYVRFTFNDIKLTARPGDETPQWIVADYDESMRNR